MKKLVFAVIAAVAMVSVSNVFAGNRMVNVAGSEPVDTVAPADTTATPVETPALQTLQRNSGFNRSKVNPPSENSNYASLSMKQEIDDQILAFISCFRWFISHF
jgi:hypothetical protein